ncbi:hypothetical protein OG989_04260 [Micromonospora sp. NBC_01740]|uniref:hypothetical protein n=1 Tax=Micromonospora sp. NBC_01740 TaxID=2975986 RepID=UPI002E12FD12|nr:hypothetical protein OG989_04260 [Micromonospora sp. NBC_01740]
MSTREELIAGLRALADFYEANPTMPAPWRPRLVPADGLPGDWSTEVCDATRDRIELAYAPVIHLAHWRAAA